MLMVIAGCAVLSLSANAFAVSAKFALTVVSKDPYTNTTSYHKTQVEPDTFARRLEAAGFADVGVERRLARFRFRATLG